jgi:trehalose 6-phosphate synthase
MRSLFAYDLAGFQSEADVTHFSHYVEAEAQAERLSHERLRAFIARCASDRHRR